MCIVHAAMPAMPSMHFMSAYNTLLAFGVPQCPLGI